MYKSNIKTLNNLIPMRRIQTNTPPCILRIEDSFHEFVKDIKVNLPSTQDWDEKALILGMTEKIFSKYVEDLNEDTCKVYLYIPKEISKEKLLEEWGNQDVTKAKTNIDDILSKLSEEQRKAILDQYK